MHLCISSTVVGNISILSAILWPRKEFGITLVLGILLASEVPILVKYSLSLFEMDLGSFIVLSFSLNSVHFFL